MGSTTLATTIPFMKEYRTPGTLSGCVSAFFDVESNS